jgi:hypothetical protein
MISLKSKVSGFVQHLSCTSSPSYFIEIAKSDSNLHIWGVSPLAYYRCSLSVAQEKDAIYLYQCIEQDALSFNFGSSSTGKEEL